MARTRHTRVLKPQDIRQHNRIAVIRLLLERAPLSQADVSRRLHISAPVVSSIMAELESKGLVCPSPSSTRAAPRPEGRPPKLLQANPNSGVLVGVAIEERDITLTAANLFGETLGEVAIANEASTDDALLTLLIQSVTDLVNDHRTAAEPLLSIGISVPGVYNPEAGQLEFAPNVTAWRNVPLKNDLTEAFACDVIVENAVNAAILGEIWHGKLKGCRDAVYIKLDHGIGAGIIADGRLQHGVRGLAGEIGFMVTSLSDLKEPKTDFGSLERHCSLQTILTKAQQIDPRIDSVSAIIAGLDAQQPGLDLLVDTVIERLAAMAANVSCVVDPDIIILGGGFSPVVQKRLDRFRRLMDNAVPRCPAITVSELGRKAFSLGAIAQSLEDVPRRLITRFFA